MVAISISWKTLLKNMIPREWLCLKCIDWKSLGWTDGHLSLTCFMDQWLLSNCREGKLLPLDLLIFPQFQQATLIICHIFETLLQWLDLILQKCFRSDCICQLWCQIINGQAQFPSLLHQGAALPLLFMQVIDYVLCGLPIELRAALKSNLSTESLHLFPQLLVVHSQALQFLFQSFSWTHPWFILSEFLSENTFSVNGIVSFLSAFLQKFQCLKLGHFFTLSIWCGHPKVRLLNHYKIQF